MAETKYANLLQKRMTADEWAASNPLLLEGQFGLDTTSGIVKLGNGRDLWLDLPALNVALEFDPATGLYRTDEASYPIVSADDNGQLPDSVRSTLASNFEDSATPEGGALADLISQTGGGSPGGASRRFVWFGDSWSDPAGLYQGVTPMPTVVVNQIGGKLLANYARSGATLGPITQNGGIATDAQVTRAQADTSYDKNTVTDVVVFIGVNNLDVYIPTTAQARTHFQAMSTLYPKAKLWFATNAKKAMNANNEPWKLYSRLFEAAALSGFAVAEYSPFWTWGVLRNSEGWWPSDATDFSKHPSAAGMTAVANRMVGFLTGESWRPYFKVPVTLHPNAASLMSSQGVSGTPAIVGDNSYVDGYTLHIQAAITGMENLASVPTSAYQAILQIPTDYRPIGDYMYFPVGSRLSGGTMDFTYAARVNGEGAGVVSVDARALNNHVSVFNLRADLPLTALRSAD